MITWEGLRGRSAYAVYEIDVDYVATSQAQETRYRVRADGRLIATNVEAEDRAKEVARRWDAFQEAIAPAFATRGR